MRKHPFAGALRVARGMLIATAGTLAAMALLTVVVWKWEIPDGMLVLINQCMKITSVAAGTFFAVGRGGSDGFLTGAVIGSLYMGVGYALYAALGGPVDAGSLLGEWLTGAAAGALSGAIAANLPHRKGKRA